jgi:sulfite exporter TauE/SafE/copper chaperone CopZ
MDKNKLTIPIEGMHCRSCELLIEDKLSEIPEVESVNLNYKKGVAEITYGEQKPNMHEVENAIRGAGYSIGSGMKESKPFFSRSAEDYKDLGIAFLFLMGIYIVARNFGLTNLNIGAPANASGLGVPLVVGLVAGISTCMALVGGLVLGISARHAEKHPEATPAQKFRPHLFFNLGRTASYAILGGILGMAGSLFQLSGVTLGVVTIIVGIVMLVLGMKLTGVFPRLESGGLVLPKGINKLFRIKNSGQKEYSHGSAMVTGALTFFLPCGFTQAMQLYAVSTGSFGKGALIMGLFALGTAPGLLGVGGLTSVVKGIFARRFFKATGILVIFLAMFNITNGYNLTGWREITGNSKLETENKVLEEKNKNTDLSVMEESGVQIVRMTENSRGYSPNKFTIKKDMPVRWVIEAKDAYSCASSITISKLGIRKNLVAGENVIEFTPKEAGKLPFSCSMGMYTGVFNVVDGSGGSVIDVDNVSSGGEASESVPAGACGVNGGCTMMQKKPSQESCH